MQHSPEFEKFGWFRALQRAGAWLAEKTITDEESEEGKEMVGPAWLIGAAILPVWLILVLVAGGFVRLPPQLSYFQELIGPGEDWQVK